MIRRGIVLAPADPSRWSHSHRLVDSLEPGDRRRLALALLSNPRGTGGDICMEAALTRHPCGWSPEEAGELLALAVPEIDRLPDRDPDHSPYGFRDVCRCLGLPLAAVREQAVSERARYRPWLRAVVLGARDHRGSGRFEQCQWHLSVEEAAALLDLPYDREVLGRLPRVLPDGDPCGNRALAALGTLVFEPGVLDLLSVLLTIDGYRPAQSWLGQVRERLEMLTVAPEVVSGLLRMDTSRPDDRTTESEPSRQTFVLDRAKLLAGASWAACLTGDPALIGLVAAQVLGRRPDRRRPGLPEREILPARAGVTALSAAAGMPGLGRHRRALSGLPPEAAAAARAALDAIADDFLSAGNRRLTLGHHTGYLAVHPDGSVGVDIRTYRGEAVTAYGMRHLNGTYVLELTALRLRLPRLAAQADRERGALAELLATGTELTGAEFGTRWLDHDVAGPLAQALVWEADTADGTFTGLPVRDPDGRWLLRDVRGRKHKVTAADTVRLWNPVHADRAQVRAWVTRLERGDPRQPVRQVPVRRRDASRRAVRDARPPRSP
ncbi:DUF4132 domain-containing protein [Streptomyces sp. cg40]|uniref:DUF4132 domain-containing protein n=1 Tax=Streptomyces sp. cg40 TaxID=3419764 RepID=UPI003D04A3C1